MAILGFRHQRLRDLLAGGAPGGGLPPALIRVLQRKLEYLASAETLADLRAPPANRLEALKGGRRGQHSIRVNDQYRLCFTWSEGGAEHVEFVDYHWGDLKMGKRVLPPVHPGEILREEFMAPLGLTAYAVAKSMQVPRTRVERLAREETAVTPDTALRLARVLGTSAELWMNLQTRFDLATARDVADDAIDRLPALFAAG